MTKKEFRDAINLINPTPAEKDKILFAIREKRQVKPGFHQARVWKFALPALAVCLCLLAVLPFIQWENSPPYEESVEELAALQDYFIFEGQRYELEYAEERKAVSEDQIGKKLGTITEGGDPGLQGRSVYRYLPANGLYYLVVEGENEWQLYCYSQTLNLVENREEDIAAFFRLFGVSGAEEIASLELDRLDGKGAFKTVTDRETLQAFYDKFSVLKSAEDEYYKTLAGTDTVPPIPPDEVGSTVKHYMSPEVGDIGDALDDATRITIRFTDGAALDAVYHPNIRFIDYYQLDDAANAFFQSLCEQN